VSTDIQATPERICALLTAPEDAAVELEAHEHRGHDRVGKGSVKLRVPEAPGRTFKIDAAPSIRVHPTREKGWQRAMTTFGDITDHRKP
jgi:hypothetical protein